MAWFYKKSVNGSEESFRNQRQAVLVARDHGKRNVPDPAPQPRHGTEDPVEKAGRISKKAGISVIRRIVFLDRGGDLPREAHDILDPTGKSLPHLFEIAFFRKSAGGAHHRHEENQP